MSTTESSSFYDDLERMSVRDLLTHINQEDTNVPISPDHKMSVAEARTEVEAEGFKLGPVIENLPRQHILIFRKSSM